jgi:hypothetical protein
MTTGKRISNSSKRTILSQSSPSTSRQSLGHLGNYGLYSSRTKGKANKDGSLARFRCHDAPKKKFSQEPETDPNPNKASRWSWALLIHKVNVEIKAS